MISSPKYDVQLQSKSLFEMRMTVIVRNLQKDDVGSYKCIAKNSLGEVESSIRLYGEHLITINYLFSKCVFALQKSRDRRGSTF